MSLHHNRRRLRASTFLVLIGLPVIILGACGPDHSAVPAASSGETPDSDTWQSPAQDPEAAARAFRLFYRERVERAIVAYNRFGIFGDSVFGTRMSGKRHVARETPGAKVPMRTEPARSTTWTGRSWKRRRGAGTTE